MINLRDQTSHDSISLVKKNFLKFQQKKNGNLSISV